MGRAVPAAPAKQDREFLYERLRRLRLEKRLSMETMAKRLGVTAVSIWHWETGECGPPRKRLVGLARALGVTVDYLLTGRVVRE